MLRLTVFDGERAPPDIAAVKGNLAETWAGFVRFKLHCLRFSLHRTLTVTRNLEHRGNGHGPYTFGFFWAGDAVPENKDGVFNGKVHGGDERAIGGGFWWPGFGIVTGAAREGST